MNAATSRSLHCVPSKRRSCIRGERCSKSQQPERKCSNSQHSKVEGGEGDARTLAPHRADTPVDPGSMDANPRDPARVTEGGRGSASPSSGGTHSPGPILGYAPPRLLLPHLLLLLPPYTFRWILEPQKTAKEL